MDKHKAIAERISERLQAMRWKRTDFAVAMGVQPSSITKWLSGEHNFTVDTLFRVEQILNVQIFFWDAIKSNVMFCAPCQFDLTSFILKPEEKEGEK